MPVMSKKYQVWKYLQRTYFAYSKYSNAVKCQRTLLGSIQTT